MRKVRGVLAFGWLLSSLSLQAASALPSLEVLPTFVIPMRSSTVFGLGPYERTRPLLLGEILYVADQQGRVVAFHRTKGFVLWETSVPGGVEGAFSYGRSKLIVGDKQGNLIALNARDGSEAWRFKGQMEWLSPPAITRGFVYAINASGDLYALSESKGEELWHYSHRGDEKMTIRGSGGPALFGTTEVYQGFADGTLVALGAEKGKVLWEKRLKSRERFYDIDMTPFVDEKRVIAATFDGRVYSLDRISGDTQWVFPVGSYSGFAVDGNRLYFGGVNKQFYALDLGSGQPVWTTPFENGVSAAPLLMGETLIFPTSTDPVYFLDRATGKVRAQVSLGAGTLASFAGSAEDGWVYGLSNYGNIYAFELRDRLLPTVTAVSAITP